MDNLKPMIADWVRAARKQAGYSQEDLGETLARELDDERGYTKANISAWENQRHSPNLRQLMAIAKVTSVGLPADLMTALGTPTSAVSADDDREQSHARPIVNAVRVVIDDFPNTIAIRRMNVSLSAGVTRLEPEYDVSFGEELQLPAEVLARGGAGPDQLIALRVKGQSMEPMMFEDDLVVVNTADTKPINREIYALLFDGEACVKQLLHRGGQWYLHSVNPDFGPVNARSGEMRVIGRVIYQPGRMVTGRL